MWKRANQTTDYTDNADGKRGNALLWLSYPWHRCNPWFYSFNFFQDSRHPVEYLAETVCALLSQ